MEGPGRPGTSVPVAEHEAALVELDEDLVQRLLAEVGDGEEVVLGLQHQLADRVDLSSLQAVSGSLGEVELLDKSEDDLLAITNFGQKSLDEVIVKLDERGLSLRTKE